MYCIKCGVELSNGQEKCPLCGTKVYHPDFISEGEETYPKTDTPPERLDRMGLVLITTLLFQLPIVLCFVCDMAINQRITWSDFVIGGVSLVYLFIVAPMWFQRPNLILFISWDFIAMLSYLVYIDYRTQGGWFLTFALPLAVTFSGIVIPVVFLRKKLKRGILYAYAGASISFGAFCVLIEYLIAEQFGGGFERFVWSFYPLAILFLIGIMFVILASCGPLLQSLKKKFFI